MKQLIFLFLGVIGSLNLQSQDLAFSQYQSLGFKLNPAQTGDFEGKYKVAAHHRSDSHYDDPLISHATSTVMFEKTLVKEENGWFGIGLGYRNSWQQILDTALLDDDMNFRTRQVDIALAYHRLFKTSSGAIHQVSLGGLLGVNQLVFDYKAHFEEPQTGYPTLDYDFLVFDLGLGLDWKPIVS